LGSGGGRSEVGFAVKKEYNEIMEMEEWKEEDLGIGKTGG
jgi:hypothetical protein